MSPLLRLSSALRPAATCNATAYLRSSLHHSKTIPSHFFVSPSVGTLGLGAAGLPLRSRFYSSAWTPHTASLNTKLLYAIIGLNCSVFAYALYLKAQAQQGHHKPLITFIQNFTLNSDSVLREGRWWTLITSVFTHLTPMHLLANMLSIYYLGGMLARTPGVGPGRFVTLILGSGLTGSVGYLSLRVHQTRDRQMRDYSRGLGFSGAVMGVGAVAAFLYPRTRMMIYGVLPMPLWALMTGYAVFDGVYLNQEQDRIAHAGHLGGLAFGVLFYFAKMRGPRL